MVLPSKNANNSGSASTEDYRIVPNDYLFSKDCCYQVQAFLGEGTFGQVARCTEMDTNNKVAIKIIKKTHHNTVLTEVDVLQVLSVEDTEKNNIVKWHEWFNYEGHTCLVFELLDISLRDFVKNSQHTPMLVQNIRKIIQQVATALKKLQSMGIMHTDLKPENIVLVDHVREPFRVKLIDFGSAGHDSNVRRGMYIQSRWYRAPEVILGLPFSHPIDVWSLGCVAAGLFMGYPMYPADSEYELVRYITQTQGQLPDKILSNGLKTGVFFVEGSDWSYTLWRLKTPEEFEDENNYRPRETRRYILNSLDELKMFKLPPNPEHTEVQDRKDFLHLLKKMLHLEEGKRITATQVLEHPFIAISNLSNSTHFPWTRSNFMREGYIPTDILPHTTNQPFMNELASSMVYGLVQPSIPVKAHHVGQCSLDDTVKMSVIVERPTTEVEAENHSALIINKGMETATLNSQVIPEVNNSVAMLTLIQDLNNTKDLTTLPSLMANGMIQSETYLNQEANALMIDQKLVEAPSALMDPREVQHTNVEVQKVQKIDATSSLIQVIVDNDSRGAKASSPDDVETAPLSLGVREFEDEASSPNVEVQNVQKLEATSSLIQVIVDNDSRGAKASSPDDVETAPLSLGVREFEDEASSPNVEVQNVQKLEATSSLIQVIVDNDSRGAKASSPDNVETAPLSLGVREIEDEASSPTPLLLQETGGLLSQEGSASLNLFQEMEALTHLLEDEAVDSETSKCLQDNMATQAFHSMSQETKVPSTLEEEPKSSSNLPEQVQRLKVKTRCPLANPKKWKICRCISRLWKLLKPQRNKKSAAANKDAS